MKYFKNKIHRNSFIISSLLIFIIFGCIAYTGIEKFGYIWQMLIIFPFAPSILMLRNFLDRNNL